MTNRRQLLQLGLSAFPASFLPAVTLAAANTQASTFPVYRILHDTRFPRSAGHARSLRQAFNLAMPALHPVAGDITRFWNSNPSRQWQKSPDALAGVTGEDVLFCLEQLARDHRMRVQWRHVVESEHAAESKGTLVAWVIAK
jgi:hypothetical protein